MNHVNPIVLVLSYGKIDPISIVNNIKLNDDGKSSSSSLEACEYKYDTYLKNIKTKYYENTIEFIPYTKDINTVPIDILQKTEVLIVFFHGEDTTFLEKLSELCAIAKNNKIELGILVTDKMSADKTDGLTYEDVKSICYESFDLIELCEENDIGSSEKMLEISYKEISEALRNHIWSNVRTGNKASDVPGNLMSSNAAEDELNSFETLINHIQSFKQNSNNLDRKIVLDQAEVLAKLFDDLLNED